MMMMLMLMLLLMMMMMTRLVTMVWMMLKDSRHVYQEFIEGLKSNVELQLSAPSIQSEAATLYMQKPPPLERHTRPNLDKPLSELVRSGEVLNVVDPGIEGTISVVLTLE
jgi:hypothetical protein